MSRANDRGREQTPNRQEKARDGTAAKEEAEPHLEEREVAPERPVKPAHTPEGDQNPGN